MMLSKKIFKSWRTDICSMAVPYADSVLSYVGKGSINDKLFFERFEFFGKSENQLLII